MRFYKLDNYITSGYSGSSHDNTANMLPYPFKTSNVDVDVSSISRGVTTKLYSGWYRKGIGELEIKADSVNTTAYTLLNINPNKHVSKGYFLLVTSPNNDNWTVHSSQNVAREIPSANISGKFRFKNSIIWGSELDNLWDGTINVSVSINGTLKRAITFSSRTEWSVDNPRTKDGSKIIIGSYNEYGDGVSIPPDFFNEYTKDGLNLEPEFVGMVWDFGSLPQEVPQTLVNWLNLNADAIYNNTYTVKSYDGNEVVSERRESPPLTALTLSTIGNTKNLIMTGTNGVEYTLTWESVTPNGKIFLGLTYGPNSNQASIPDGQSTQVTIDSSVTWYEVYATYRPPITTFDINLYQNSSEPHRLDKTNYLTAIGTLEGALRDESSITDMVITFESTNVPNFNYVYIPIFNRYYFVNDITSLKYKLWQVSLSVDTLMTYKNAILSCRGFVDRNERASSPMIVDKKRVVRSGKTVSYTAIPNELFTETNGWYVLNGLALSTHGGDE